jgi:hypothetical protein
MSEHRLQHAKFVPTFVNTPHVPGAFQEPPACNRQYLPAQRVIGFDYDRRLLGVQGACQDTIAGGNTFQGTHYPMKMANGDTLVGLRFCD